MLESIMEFIQNLPAVFNGDIPMQPKEVALVVAFMIILIAGMLLR